MSWKIIIKRKEKKRKKVLDMNKNKNLRRNLRRFTWLFLFVKTESVQRILKSLFETAL